MPGADAPHEALHRMLQAFEPVSPDERADLARVTALLQTEAEPWHRATPLHLTASALIVHPPSACVLLRWHARLRAWLQVGGHAEPGETDPLRIALREAAEESGLGDLQPWPPDGGEVPWQLVVVPVPARGDEPAHEHADIRYVFATEAPDAVVAESPDAALRWLPVADALRQVTEDNLRELLRRVDRRWHADD